MPMTECQSIDPLIMSHAMVTSRVPEWGGGDFGGKVGEGVGWRVGVVVV